MGQSSGAIELPDIPPRHTIYDRPRPASGARPGSSCRPARRRCAVPGSHRLPPAIARLPGPTALRLQSPAARAAFAAPTRPPPPLRRDPPAQAALQRPPANNCLCRRWSTAPGSHRGGPAPTAPSAQTSRAWLQPGHPPHNQALQTSETGRLPNVAQPENRPGRCVPCRIPAPAARDGPVRRAIAWGANLARAQAARPP